MADIKLNTNYNWSVCKTSTTCSGYGGSPTYPASDDTVYLGTTGTTGYTLTLDGAEGATYTCVAIKAVQGTDKTTKNNGKIASTNYANSPGPNLDFELYAGTGIALTVASGKKVNRITKVVAGSASSSFGCQNGGDIGTITTVVGGTGAVACYGVRNDLGATISLIGTVTGGSGGTSAYGLYNSGSVTTVTATYGHPTGGAHGISNQGSGYIGLIGSATGGGGTGSAGTIGCMNLGTIAEVTSAMGGSYYGAHGVSNSLGFTFDVAVAKGGTHLCAAGIWEVIPTDTSGLTVVASTDDTGVGPACGPFCRIVDNSTFRASAINLEGNAKVLAVPTPDIVAASAIKKGTAQYTGGATGTFVASPGIRPPLIRIGG